VRRRRRKKRRRILRRRSIPRTRVPPLVLILLLHGKLSPNGSSVQVEITLGFFILSYNLPGGGVKFFKIFSAVGFTEYRLSMRKKFYLRGLLL
jgi:hypothetical protein